MRTKQENGNCNSTKACSELLVEEKMVLGELLLGQQVTVLIHWCLFRWVVQH